MMFSKYLAVALIFFVNFNSIAQSAYTEKDKKNFYSGVFNGCSDKQKQGEANKALKEGVTDELCSCIAESTTSNVFGDMDFQIALSRNDKLGAKRIIDKNMTPDNTASMFNSCMVKLEKKYGSKENLFAEKSNAKLSEKIGLTGESRAGFFDSGVASCMTEKSGFGKEIDRKYCSCYMNYMADRVSQKDLIDMGKQTERMKRKSAELREKAIDVCLPILRKN